MKFKDADKLCYASLFDLIYDPGNELASQLYNLHNFCHYAKKELLLPKLKYSYLNSLCVLFDLFDLN